jgi:hypothetical protein
MWYSQEASLNTTETTMFPGSSSLNFPHSIFTDRMGLAPPSNDRLGVHGPEAFRRSGRNFVPWCVPWKTSPPLKEAGVVSHRERILQLHFLWKASEVPEMGILAVAPFWV